MKYKAILFNPDGSYVTDYSNGSSIEDIWSLIADQGSKWIFYPICFVATDKTIVGVPEGAEIVKNKRIKTVQNLLKRAWKEDSDAIVERLESGAPFDFIYWNHLSKMRKSR